MGRVKIYTDEEIRLRRLESNRRYKKTINGRKKQKEAIKRYQETDKFKNYKKEYYKRMKDKDIEND